MNIAGIPIGNGAPIVLVAGPCVIESEQSAIRHARAIKEITDALGIPFVYKSSFDKANRSSIDSFRGPGMEEGLRILTKVKQEVGVPVLTDIHEASQAQQVAKVADCMQIPAFLCRQTDLLVAAGKTNVPICVKKSQMLSGNDMSNVVKKLQSTGNNNILLCERGTFFGYNTLVNDFRAIQDMRTLAPVMYDGTHSVQQPGGKGTASGGAPQYIPGLVRAATAFGIDALFLEVHEEPLQGKCDGPNMLRLDELKQLLEQVLAIQATHKNTSA